MQLNPILALELRARWRSNRSFLLLLGVALALGLLTAFIYERAVSYNADANFDPFGNAVPLAGALRDNARLSDVGRQLFVALAHANILCWLLIAAASAATGIARERERGLLESLQLSRMSAPGQIAARFGANLLLLGALQLVLLPIYAVAFVMRGISPAEIAQAFYLVFWASISGSALGLWFSARSHRPTSALFSALGAIALFCAYLGWDTGGGFSIQSGSLEGHQWLDLLHPTAIFIALSSPDFRWPLPVGGALLIFGLAHLLFSGALLWGATRNVNRNLAPASWGGRSIWVERLRARQVATAQAATATPSKTKGRASGALLADLPLDRFVRFANPLLAREVKSRFRLRRAGVGLSIVRGGLFLLAITVWLWEVFWLFDVQSRAEMAPYGLFAMLFGGALVLSVLSATSWTREREAGTWEALKLSLLKPREILRAKWLSPLVSFGYYSAPLWILLPIGALFVSVWAFIAGAFIVAAWLGLSVALGLWIGWRVRNGTAAIAWTTGILATLLIGLPVLDDVAGISELLAKRRFGVDGRGIGYSNSALYGNQPLNENFIQFYTSETGRPAPKPANFARLAPGQSFIIPPDWDALQRWEMQQNERAQNFEARTMAWNPVLTLGDLFAPGSSTSSDIYGRRMDEAQFDILTRVALGTLAPALLTLVLLALLRRDVKREQLGL